MNKIRGKLGKYYGQVLWEGTPDETTLGKEIERMRADEVSQRCVDAFVIGLERGGHIEELNNIE